MVVYGSYARLENIDEKGCWRESEEFQVGDRRFVRTAGARVPGNLLGQWRKLRAEEPELFAGVRVWSQPSAFVDAVLFGWQVRLESAENQGRPVLRLCDMFAGGWTREVAELNWLSQTIQTGVASQMTAMTQITDIGLSLIHI